MNQDRDQGGADVFIVKVQFRQNATWQGTVRWAGQNEEQRFRSTLELLKILDGAVAARHPDDRGQAAFVQPQAAKKDR